MWLSLALKHTKNADLRTFLLVSNRTAWESVLQKAMKKLGPVARAGNDKRESCERFCAQPFKVPSPTELCDCGLIIEYFKKGRRTKCARNWQFRRRSSDLLGNPESATTFTQRMKAKAQWARNCCAPYHKWKSQNAECPKTFRQVLPRVNSTTYEKIQNFRQFKRKQLSGFNSFNCEYKLRHHPKQQHCLWKAKSAALHRLLFCKQEKDGENHFDEQSRSQKNHFS